MMPLDDYIKIKEEVLATATQNAQQYRAEKAACIAAWIFVGAFIIGGIILLSNACGATELAAKTVFQIGGYIWGQS